MGGLRRTGAQLSGVAVEPMGMALSVSGNHFARHTTLILLVSLLPSAQSSRPGLGGWREGASGVGVAVALVIQASPQGQCQHPYSKIGNIV